MDNRELIAELIALVFIVIIVASGVTAVVAIILIACALSAIVALAAIPIVILAAIVENLKPKDVRTDTDRAVDELKKFAATETSKLGDLAESQVPTDYIFSMTKNPSER